MSIFSIRLGRAVKLPIIIQYMQLPNSITFTNTLVQLTIPPYKKLLPIAF